MRVDQQAPLYDFRRRLHNAKVGSFPGVSISSKTDIRSFSGTDLNLRILEAFLFRDWQKSNIFG
jgi:hypothetical protein